jgi:hypothetical protein
MQYGAAAAELNEKLMCAPVINGIPKRIKA